MSYRFNNIKNLQFTNLDGMLMVLFWLLVTSIPSFRRFSEVPLMLLRLQWSCMYYKFVWLFLVTNIIWAYEKLINILKISCTVHSFPIFNIFFSVFSVAALLALLEDKHETKLNAIWSFFLYSIFEIVKRSLSSLSGVIDNSCFRVQYDEKHYFEARKPNNMYIHVETKMYM